MSILRSGAPQKIRHLMIETFQLANISSIAPPKDCVKLSA